MNRKKHLFRQAMASFLVAVLLLTSAPLSGFVGLELSSLTELFTSKAQASNIDCDYSNDAFWWELDKDTGILKIGGNGPMLGSPWDRNYVREVRIYSGITSISDYAFSNHFKLQTINIPGTVTYIADRAFQWASGLNTVYLPLSCTSMGFCAFNYCYNLKDVYYEGTKSQFDSIKKSYAGIGGFDDLFNATKHYNYKYDYYQTINETMDEIKQNPEAVSTSEIFVVDADNNPVDGAIVSINTGVFGEDPLISEPSKNGRVSFDGINLSSEKYRFAMVSAELNLDNGIVLSSKNVSSDGVWQSERLSNLLKQEIPTLKVDEPIWQISISVGYVGKTEKERETRYKKIKSELEKYCQKFAEMTNGHCLISNVSITDFSSDSSLNDNLIHSMTPFDFYIFEDSDFARAGKKSYKTNSATTYYNDDSLIGFKYGGFVVFEYNNGCFCAETLCHESGHLLFDLKDEYCYGKKYYMDTNNDGLVCGIGECSCTDTDNDGKINHVDIRGSGEWKRLFGPGRIDRPVINGQKAPSLFGVMENESKTIELSNRLKYEYLNSVDFDPSHPEWYTYHYYMKHESTEETVARFLIGKASSAGYSAEYTLSNGCVQKASYSYSKIQIPDYSSNSASMCLPLEEIENIDSIKSNLDSLIFNYDNSIITVQCTSSDISNIYVENMGNLEEIEIQNNQFEIVVPEISEKLIVVKDHDGVASKETFSIINDNGTIYVSSDAAINQDEFISVDNMISILNIEGQSYTISRSLVGEDVFNYDNTAWYYIDENGQHNKLDTEMSFGERTEIAYSCNITSVGTYVLMSTPAVEKAEETISNFRISNDIEGDGILNISFDDSSSENELYSIYYSLSPIEDIDSDDVYSITVNDASDISLYVYEEGTYYFAVKAKCSDGSYTWYKDIGTFNYKSNDSNNDGIPDVWFEDYYMLEDSDTVALEDPDEDGLINIFEYKKGTNPIDPDTDGDNVYDGIEVSSNLNPLKKCSDGKTDDYSIVYGTPDLSVLEVAPVIIDDEVVCTLTNKSAGKAMRTNICLYIDNILTSVWNVNVDSKSVLEFSFPVEYLTRVVNNLRIEVDENQITRDTDYTNNTFVYSPITELSFEKDTITIIKGESVTLVPNVDPKDANPIFKWSISGKNITLENGGVVKSNGIGSAVITAETFDGLSASCTVQAVAFEGAELSDFDSKLINNDTEVAIIGYIGDDDNIVIPKKIGSLPVTQLSSNAFKCCNFKEVTIHDGIDSISNTAFSETYSLENIAVDAQNTTYCSVDGILYSYDKTQLIKYPSAKTETKFAIPETVTTIGAYSMENCNHIEEITIPESVSSIGNRAIGYCSNLITVNYNAASCSTPSGFLGMYYSPFNSSNRIEKVIIGENVDIIPPYLFYGKSSLSEVVIADDSKLSTIAQYAFYGCSKLTSITIPETVRTIETSAFYNCIALGKTELSFNISSIGTNAFANCPNLTIRCYYRTPAYTYATTNSVPYEIIDVPSTGVQIDDITVIKGTTSNISYSIEPWYSSDEVSYISSNTDVATITDGVITASKCGRTTITITTDSGKTDTCVLSVVGISGAEVTDFDYTLANDNTTVTITGYTGSDKNIVVPDTIGGLPVTYINSTFDGCDFESVTIGKNVSSWSTSNFNLATKLKNIYVAEGNTTYSSIDGVLYNFSGNTLYKYPCGRNDSTYTIPNIVTSISGNAFSYSSIESIRIPEGIKSLGFSAFSSCSNLKTVYYDAIHCTTTSIFSISPFSSKVENFVVGEKVEYLPGYLLKNASVSEIIIPASVTSIDESAFYDFGQLTIKAYVNSCAKYYAESNGYDFVAITCGNCSCDDWQIITDSSCTEEGTKIGICDVCGADMEGTIPIKEHNYVSTITAPSCTTDGFTTHTCSICGDTYTDSAISALGHSFTNYISDNNASCAVDGTKTAKCDRCDVTNTETDEGSKLGHIFTNYVSNGDATCTSDGTMTAKCDRCDVTSTVTDEGSAKGHTIVVDKAIAPNCTETGLTEGQHCSVCDEILVKQEVIPMADHTDADHDGKCDCCDKDMTENCTCICHKSGFLGFIYKIIRIFWKLFGINKICDCGKTHY